MNNNTPTPKTLTEAVTNGLLSTPLNEVVKVTRASVRDFLSQKFGAMMLKETDEHTQAALKELWNKITGESL